MGGKRSASTAFIMVTLLLDTLGIGLVVPIVPRLIGGFLGGDVAEASRYYGAFIASYATMQFVFAPILGGLSDRFGRRPVLLGSQLGGGLDYVLMAVAPGLSWLFVGRLISGITGARFSAATAYIADVTPPERRAQAFGLVGAAFGVGFVVGPALGGALGEVDLRLPFVVAAGLNFANFLYGLFVLPESLPPEKRQPFTLRRANPLSSLAALLGHPKLLSVTGIVVCAIVAQQILQASWALSAQGRFGWSALEVGLSLTVVGLVTAVVQGGLLRVLMPRLGERRAVLVGTALSIAGFAGLGLADRGWMVIALIFPFSLRGLAGPAAQAMMSREFGASDQGRLQGSYASLQSVAAIVGPLIGGSLLSRLGDRARLPYVPGAPFFAAALLDLVGLLLALRLFRRQPDSLARPAS